MEELTEDDWSEFEKQLGSNSLSPSKFEEFEKIYVICEYGYEYDFKWRVYCISLNASETPLPPPLEPIIIWDQDYHFYSAIAFLGSRMFIFGGSKSDGIWEKDMYFYDIPSAVPGGPIRLGRDKSLLRRGPDMSGSKCNPVAVVIGDSKICVFGIAARLSSPPYFELYDTIDDDWKSLPKPLPYNWATTSLIIQSYCVHGSCLIIQTEIHGMYGINIDNPNLEWVKLGQRGLFDHFSFVGLWTMVGKQLYNPFHVVRWPDIGEHKFVLKSSSSSSPLDRESLVRLRTNGVLCSRGANLVFILRSGFLYEDEFPMLLVDIVKLDGTEELQSDGLEIQSDLSLTFSFSHPFHHIDLLACFPIKRVSTSASAIS